jgi:hypothetical protein
MNKSKATTTIFFSEEVYHKITFFAQSRGISAATAALLLMNFVCSEIESGELSFEDIVLKADTDQSDDLITIRNIISFVAYNYLQDKHSGVSEELERYLEDIEKTKQS